MTVLEAIQIAALRIKHTVGVTVTPFGRMDVYDPEGELLFGKVTGIVACPRSCFWAHTRTFGLPDMWFGWFITGVAVRGEEK